MKFNWGVGIFIFLGLFLTAAAIFIIFAFRQNVDLVHEDYYERGADYSTQMEIDARSAAFADKIGTQTKDGAFIIGFRELPGASLDSGNIKLYRPSDSKLDLELAVKEGEMSWAFPVEKIANGRYILDFTWYMNGLKYEIRKPLSINP